MKKYLIVLGLLAVSLLFSPSASAQSQNCETMQFPNASACVWVEKMANTEYRVQYTVNSSNAYEWVVCDVFYGSNYQYQQACNQPIYYNNNSIEPIRIRLNIGGTSKTITRNYNFGNGTWAGSLRDNTNNQLHTFSLLASQNNPNLYQPINITIRARDRNNNTITNYSNRVDFSVQYRANSSSSWQTSPSSRYVLDRNSYNFSWNDNGSVTLHNLIEFRNTGQYRLVVRDNNNNITSYISFTIWGSSWNNNNQLHTFSLLASQNNPNLYQPINITIRARDRNNNTITNYTNRVDFSVQYRASNSSSRQASPSSRYVLDRNSYNFSWNDNGSVTLHNLIEFRNNGHYRLVVRDNSNNISNWIEFTIGQTDSNQYGPIQNFRVTASHTNPSIYQRVNVTIQARDNLNRIVQNYTRNVSLKVQYRPYSNSARQNAPSSHYILNRSNYSFSWSDYGTVTLQNLVEFRNNGTYRLVVEDSWNNIVGYATFTVWGSNNNYNPYNPGFTNSQINQIQSIYTIWPIFIDKLKDNYPILRNHSTWNNQQAALYQQMHNILNNYSSIYNNYNSFFNAFRDRYIYTLQIRD